MIKLNKIYYTNIKLEYDKVWLVVFFNEITFSTMKFMLALEKYD